MGIAIAITQIERTRPFGRQCDAILGAEGGTIEGRGDDQLGRGIAFHASQTDQRLVLLGFVEFVVDLPRAFDRHLGRLRAGTPDERLAKVFRMRRPAACGALAVRLRHRSAPAIRPVRGNDRRA